jgi:hypothetical protein
VTPYLIMVIAAFAFFMGVLAVYSTRAMLAAAREAQNKG